MQRDQFSSVSFAEIKIYRQLKILMYMVGFLLSDPLTPLQFQFIRYVIVFTTIVV